MANPGLVSATPSNHIDLGHSTLFETASKAALEFEVKKREEERAVRSQESWPFGALKALDEGIRSVRQVSAGIACEPSDLLWEMISPSSDQGAATNVEWDVFISHASEDKEDFVRLLADGLRKQGLKVWFDELTLTVGDSLRRAIDRGLARSRFGIVVISPHFMRKDWPQKELDGLVAREVAGLKVILPVWHRITADDIRAYSPMLADRLAVSSAEGLDSVVAKLLEAVKRA